MSDEPQPLRLKPRPPAAAEASPPPAPLPPPPPPPGAEQGEGAARLRLKPRLNLVEEKVEKREEAAPPPEPFISPPPPPAAVAPPEPAPAEDDGLPKFKLRPKNSAPAPAPAPPPRFDPPPEPYVAPPPPPAEAYAPPPPPPSRSSVSMPPMSVLSAPPPPSPGSAPEAPPAPGSVPRLSMAPPPAEKPGAPKPGVPKQALNIKVADKSGKPGGKPPVVKPGKPGKAPTPAAVLGKRSALGPVAKAGIAVLAVAVVIGGIFSYRIFFPPPTPEVVIKMPTVAKPIVKPADTQSDLTKKRLADQAKIDAAVAGEDVPTPTPTPGTAATESVLAQTDLTADVKVNTTHLDAAPAASPAFRTFVANASIGGVFQGTPSRALINGSIIREGQVADSGLGILFERIDSDKKAIFFKDGSGAEVSKNY